MATRFWVGGSGTWDASTTTNWAATSGGASGASAPTTSDTVTFDTLSGLGTCTLSGSPACASLTASVSTVTTFTGTGTLTCAGNFTLEATLTVSGWTGTVTFTGTGSQTTTFAGNTMAFAVTVNAPGGTYQLQDALNMGAKTLTLTAGTLDTNGKAITCGVLNPNSSGSTCVLTLGASVITMSASWSPSFSSGLTINAGTSSITISSGGSFNSSGTFTYYDLSLAGSANATTLGSGTNTFHNLTITAAVLRNNMITLGGNQTVTNTFTATGNSAINRLLVMSTVPGTQRTITCNGGTAITSTDFQDINAAGSPTPNWDVSAVTGLSGDAGGNSGLTFVTGTTLYWFKDTGSWSNSALWFLGTGGTGGAGRVPLAHDNVVFDGSSFSAASKTVTCDMNLLGSNITWTGATNTPTMSFSNNTTHICGNLTLISAMVLSGSLATNFDGRGSQTITSATLTFAQPITITCGAGSYTQQDAMIVSGTFTLTTGTFSTNNFSAQSNAFSSSNSNVRALTLGSSTWSLTSTGTIWNTTTSTNFTLTSNTSTIKATDTSNTTITFAAGANTYNNLWFARGASTASITISGSSTYNDFKDSGTAAHSLLFTTGSTYTVSTFTMPNISSAVVTINSTTTGTHTLKKINGGQISCDWLNIQHSIATPAATTWYAGANSVNNQATATAGSGWTFTTVPTQQDADFMHPVNQPTNHYAPSVVTV